MKCQYQPVTSTRIDCESAGRRSIEATPALSRATTPPKRWTPCMPVNRYTKELLGLLDTKKPLAASSRQTIHCPVKKLKPSTTVKASQEAFSLASRETPG